jgi:beta-lactamase regulating signal transducer with metallopeptidase domain
MISFLLTSVLVSMVGIGIYLGLRRWLSFVERKQLLYLILAGSLLLPVVSPLLIPYGPTVPLASNAFFQPADAVSLQHFCQCEKPEFTHRVQYRTHLLINLMLDHEGTLGLLMLAAMGFVLFRLLLRYAFLGRLVRKYGGTEHRYGTENYLLLRPQKPLGPAAFRLGRSYIIWDTRLDVLKPEERQAVIAHEFSHLRQRNTLEKSLLNLLQCFWLLNPAFYFIRHELDQLSEYIADAAGAWEMGSRKAYAQLLLSLKTVRPIPLATQLTGGKFKQRIRMLISPPAASLPPAARFLLTGMAFFGLLISAPLLSGEVDAQLKGLELYSEIHATFPEKSEMIYCPDCRTACWTEEVNPAVWE